MDKPARISRSDFEAWREDRVTQWFMDAVESIALENQAMWNTMLETIPAAQDLYAKAIELRSRIETAADLINCDYETACEKLDEEPSAE